MPRLLVTVCPVRRSVGALSGSLIVSFVVACSSSAPASPAQDGAPPADAGPAACASPGGPTLGPADSHCVQSDGGAIAQTTDSASCHPDAAPPGRVADACPYGDTMFGTDAGDDDCKYHLTWSSTPVCRGSAGVTFTVILTNAVDHSPAVWVNLVAEVFTTSPADASCDTQSMHAGPNSGVILREISPGTYSGPIEFDVGGQWTVRFHFREDCADTLPTSPHGHAAFHLTVP